MKIVVAAGAREDVKLALAWYDERSDSAGDRFLQDLSLAFQKIRRSPTRWRPLQPGDPRRVIHLETFHYRVVYRKTPHQIRILIIRHDAR